MIVHTILYVKDQSRSCDFYWTLLGIEPSLNVPGMTEFHLSATTILGIMPEAGIKKLIGEKIPNPSDARGIPRAELYFHVEDPEIYIDRAVASGATIISEFLPRDWGDSVGYLLDLDGHVLAFAKSNSKS